MARRIGTGSVSSLARTAMAAQERKMAYEDAVKDYEFQMSGKTPEAYAAYTEYLATRAKGVSDPMKQLSMQKKMDESRRSFRSEELQRENIQINYGNKTPYDKRNLLDRQYQEALANEDYTLAQTIESQRGALDMAIQSKEDADARRGQADAERGARESLSALKRGFNKEISDADEAVRVINAAYTKGAIINIPLYDDKGKPVMGPDGKQVIRRTKLDERNQQQFLGGILKFKENKLEEAKSQTDDPDYIDSLEGKLTALRTSGDYLSYASPTGIAERNNRADGGEDPYATKVHPTTRKRTKFEKDLLDSVPMLDKDGKQVLDEDGNVIMMNKYKTGVYSSNGKANTVVRNVREFSSDKPEGYMRDYATDVQYEEGTGRPFTYAPGYDPKQPGVQVMRKFYVDPNAKEGEKPQLSLTPFQGTANLSTDLKDLGTSAKEWVKQNPLLAGFVPGMSETKNKLTKDGGYGAKRSLKESLVGMGLRSSGLGFVDSLRGLGKNIPGAGSALNRLGSTGGFIANLLGIDASKRQDAKNLAELEAKRRIAMQTEARQRAEQARIAAVNFAAQQALSRVPKAPTAPAPRFNVNNNRVEGGIGAPATPKAVTTAQNTVGSSLFNETYLPAANWLNKPRF